MADEEQMGAAEETGYKGARVMSCPSPPTNKADDSSGHSCRGYIYTGTSSTSFTLQMVFFQEIP